MTYITNSNIRKEERRVDQTLPGC